MCCYEGERLSLELPQCRVPYFGVGQTKYGVSPGHCRAKKHNLGAGLSAHVHMTGRGGSLSTTVGTSLPWIVPPRATVVIYLPWIVSPHTTVASYLSWIVSGGLV